MLFFQDWYRHEIYSALSVEQAIETKYGWALQLFRKPDCLKKIKKSTTDYITRNSKFKPHCQHKKVRKKVIEVGFFSAEICTWMHLKYDFVRFFKYIKYCLGGGYDSEQSDQIYIKRFIEIRVKSTLLFVIIIKFSLLLLPRKILRFFYLANHSEQFVL